MIKIFILFLSIWASTIQAQAATIGNTNHDASNYSDFVGADKADVLRIQIPNDGTGGTIDSLTFYGRTVSGTHNIKGLVFASNSTIPSTSLGRSAAISINATAAWKVITFSTPIAVSSNAYYGVGIVGDSGYRIYDYASGAYSRAEDQGGTITYATDGNWGTTETYNQNAAYASAMYVNYTANGGGSSTPIQQTITIQ